MRTWARHSERNRCGNCRREFAAGEPRQVIAPDASRAIKRQLVRCQQCADGEPPVDLPSLVVRPVAIDPSPMVRASKVAMPFDFKTAAAGREPGSDDE